MLDLGKDTVIHCPLGLWVPPSPLSLPRINFTGCPYQCAAGHFGNKSQETKYTCSGECNRGGQYCPAATAQPLLCPAGTYLPVGVAGLVEASCIPCAPGAFNPDEGGARCLTCPAGKLSENVSSTECSDCPRGGSCSAEGATSLRQTFTPCPAGTFNPDGGQNSSASCQACAPGKANPIPGSSEPADCRNCSAGSAQPSSAMGSCNECRPGTFQHKEGQSSCSVCPTGSYSANVLSCELCQLGEFCPAGSVVGTSCPLGSTTEGRGAEGLDACGCREGTYNAVPGEEISCMPCSDDMLCARTGLTLATVPLPPSRWRLSVTDHHIRTWDPLIGADPVYLPRTLPEPYHRHQDMRHFRRHVPLPWRRRRHQMRRRPRRTALRMVLPSCSLLRRRYGHLQRVRQRGTLCSQAARCASGDRRLSRSAAPCLAPHAAPIRPGLKQASAAGSLHAAPWSSGQVSCHSSNSE